MTWLGYHVQWDALSISRQDSLLLYSIIMSRTWSMMYTNSYRSSAFSPQYEPFHVSNGYLPWEMGPSVAT